MRIAVNSTRCTPMQVKGMVFALVTYVSPVMAITRLEAPIGKASVG